MPKESDLLLRLRKSIRLTGLNADLATLDPQHQSMIVTNRLAQTTLRYLTNEVDAAAGQRLSEELRTLSSPEEYELLFDESGYTFFHVVQFLYEFAKTYANTSDREYFCAGMGRGGGGLEVAPHTEFISLISLLISALPDSNDEQHLVGLIQELGSTFLGRIFTSGLLEIDVIPKSGHHLDVTLQYSQREQLAEGLAELGHVMDAGAFFINSALHIQGLLQLAWITFTRDASSVVMEDLIENRNEKQVMEISKNCHCTWPVRWDANVELDRAEDGEMIFAQARVVVEALQRKDLEYYLQRIKTLEVQVQALEEGSRFHDLIGGSKQMRLVYQTIQQVAATDLTVLIRGETGTGKELVARAVHQCSDQNEGPFVPVNCAAFPEALLKSELFGHERGAFTGADRQKPGRFEMANGGTLFLDEIGDISPATQVKLLRVLEDQTFERVGGTRSVTTNARIVAATNRKLEEMIGTGEFREDLYFRLNVLPINIPPLRTRREDIALLAQHFLERSAERSGKPIEAISRSAMKRLVSHPWPGNIRDLQNVMERAVIVYASGRTLTEAHISQALGLQPRESALSDDPLNERQLKVLRVMEGSDSCVIQDLVDQIESSAGGGTSRRTLQNDLRSLDNRGLVAWTKRGSARAYRLTPEGEDAARLSS